jgi:hypothetical protein
VLPFDKTGKRLPGLIADVDLVVVEGGVTMKQHEDFGACRTSNLKPAY